MKRRDFLTRATIATATIGLRREELRAAAGSISKPAGKWRGVNLGGWLVLEKWITPSVYAGVQAADEYTLCEALGKTKASERLKRHRETWVTAEDFDWLKARGINAVRIPVNYGVAEENPPFITGMDTLDWAFRTAQKARHRSAAGPARRARQPERLGPQRPPGHTRLAYQQGEHRPFRCASSPTWHRAAKATTT